MDVITIRVGIDIGQKVDPTAISVVERTVRMDGEHFECRFLERQPLGTPYPAIAQRLAAIIGGVEQRLRVFDPRFGDLVMPDLDLEAYADATGVGQPVLDLLNASGLTVTPVYFTYGDRRSVVDGQVMLGKSWLVSRLKTLFQTGRIHLPPRHPEAEAMARELEDYEIRVGVDANEKYGSFKVGSHDDLVTSLGLAVQGDVRPRPYLDPVLASAFIGLPGSG